MTSRTRTHDSNPSFHEGITVTTNSSSTMPALVDTECLRALCTELQNFLVRTMRAADDEIRAYPTPIPRCDAQFNYVYEQRSRASRWLNHTNAALKRNDATSDLVGAIAEFAASPPVGESAEEQHLRERLRAVLL